MSQRWHALSQERVYKYKEYLPYLQLFFWLILSTLAGQLVCQVQHSGFLWSCLKGIHYLIICEETGNTMAYFRTTDQCIHEETIFLNILLLWSSRQSIWPESRKSVVWSPTASHQNILKDATCVTLPGALHYGILWDMRVSILNRVSMLNCNIISQSASTINLA